MSNRFRKQLRRMRWRLRARRGRLLALVLLLVVAGGVYLARRQPDLRTGSTVVGSGRVDVGSRTPEAYRIVYRSENHAGDETVVNTEELVVRRPFEARSTVRRRGGESDDAITVNAFARLQNGDTVLATGPAPASLDHRAVSMLTEATRDGYAERRELRRVARRLCRIYRMAGSSGTASLEPVSRAKDDYSEVCVDAAGLVLEQVGFVGGELLTRKVAVRVDEDPKIDDEAFDVGEPSLAVRQGGGSVRPMADDSRPPEEAFWEPDNDPEGFEHEGRYAVVPPQAGFDDPTQRGGLIAFTSDVWVDGLDVIVVEQGATLGGSAPFAEHPDAKDVEVGELGEGQVVYGFLSAEVRVLRDGGRFVRVIGTVEPSRLLATARSLEEREGGTLVFEDEDEGAN